MRTKFKVSVGDLRETGTNSHLKARTLPYLVAAANNEIQGVAGEYSSQPSARLSEQCTTSTLRTQAVDLSASNQTIQDAAEDDGDETRSSTKEDAGGCLLDMTMTSLLAKKRGEKAGDKNLLILYAGGKYNNELLAIIVSAPRFVRSRNQAAFDSYQTFLTGRENLDPLTLGELREVARLRDEEAAEERPYDETLEDGSNDQLLSRSVLLHTFPSRIRFVQFGAPLTPFGRAHSGPWVCVGTTSSTVFASVEASTRKELLLGFPELRLVSLLDILHRDSILPSGVRSRSHRGVEIHDVAEYKARSKHPILHVRFHPDDCTRAITIDSKGNIGLFSCDLLAVRESSWDRAISWIVKLTSDDAKESGRWQVEWEAEAEDIIIVSNSNLVEARSLQDISRTTIYTCHDASVVSMSVSAAPHTWLWVVTKKCVLLFDRSSESAYKPLLSWEHHRSEAGRLRLRNLPYSSSTGSVVLSHRDDRMLTIFSATLEHSTNQAKAEGEPLHLPTSLGFGATHACEPAFANVGNLSTRWFKWIRRVSWDKRPVGESDKLMVELSTDGSVRVRALMWAVDSVTSPHISSVLPSARFVGRANVITNRTHLPVNGAERTLHSLVAFYRALMTRWKPYGSSVQEAQASLMRASRWLQEQDVPEETVLLPHDLLTLSNNGEKEESGNLSNVMRWCCCSEQSSRVSPRAEMQAALSRFLLAAKSDAWTLDLHSVTKNFLSSAVPVPDSDIEELSERLAQVYFPMDSEAGPVHSPEVGRMWYKMLDCCREVHLDLLLSSQVLSMRPVIVQDAGELCEEQEIDIKPGPASMQQPPPFTFAFFTPRSPIVQYNSTYSRHHSEPIPPPPPKRVLTEAAQWLLSEWQVGSDPKDYVFWHPYGDAEDGSLAGSQDRPTPSGGSSRGDRYRSASLRSISLPRAGNGDNEWQDQADQWQAASQPLPPTIASASQPATITSSYPRPPAFQSQPTLPSVARLRPKKRRKGGF